MERKETRQSGKPARKNLRDMVIDSHNKEDTVKKVDDNNETQSNLTVDDTLEPEATIESNVKNLADNSDLQYTDDMEDTLEVEDTSEEEEDPEVEEASEMADDLEDEDNPDMDDAEAAYYDEQDITYYEEVVPAHFKSKKEGKRSKIKKPIPKRVKKEKHKRIPKDKGEKQNSKSKKVFACMIFLLVICFTTLFAANDFSIPRMINSITSLFSDDSGKVAEGKANSRDPSVQSNGNSDSISSGGELSTNVEDEQARLNAIAENSRVYCVISSSPYFKSAKSKGSLFISNPKKSRYYTQVIIKTKDTQKKMYVSPLLEPNKKIEYDYLTNKDFDPGEYKANAYFNYYSKTGNSGTNRDYTYIGTMCAEVEIEIATSTK